VFGRETGINLLNGTSISDAL